MRPRTLVYAGVSLLVITLLPAVDTARATTWGPPPGGLARSYEAPLDWHSHRVTRGVELTEDGCGAGSAGRLSDLRISWWR